MSRVPIVLAVVFAAACGNEKDADVIAASGHVEATEVRVSAKVPGQVEAIPVQEGDRVATGQEIARIDTTDARLALDGALAERAQADAERRLRVAGSRKEDVAEGEAQVERARADVRGAQGDLERMERLLASGSGTDKSRDDARTRRDVAAASLDAAQERLRKLRAGARREEIEAATARVAAADARIAQLRQQIADAVVTSPVDGVLTEKLVEKGELLTRGAGLAVVTELARPWLTVYVSEPDLGLIRLGQAAEVITDSGDSRTGRVTFVSPQAEFTPKNVQTPDERARLVYKVKIGLDNADGLFKPGMPAEARLRPAPSAESVR
ncbi:MAG TPA: efflux RND transporter periplasmic adaptor subunit [Vicinamibacteria bacterium]|nr:efflux RND transporter periplasmic adaptor subunit [Vicinamibacteria bacterium]